MPAAIAIPALIGGAASLGGAALQAHAAGNAGKTQQRGANQALAAQRDAYGVQQGLYQNMLGGASSTLSRLTGQTPGTQFAAPQGGPGQFQGVPGMGMPAMQRGSSKGPLSLGSGLGGFGAGGQGGGYGAGGQAGMPLERPMGSDPRMSLGRVGMPGGLQPGGMPGMQPGGPGGQAGAQPGGMITLRAPDGSIEQVPAGLADRFLALGAQRVQ